MNHWLVPCLVVRLCIPEIPRPQSAVTHADSVVWNLTSSLGHSRFEGVNDVRFRKKFCSGSHGASRSCQDLAAAGVVDGDARASQVRRCPMPKSKHICIAGFRLKSEGPPPWCHFQPLSHLSRFENPMSLSAQTVFSPLIPIEMRTGTPNLIPALSCKSLFEVKVALT